MDLFELRKRIDVWENLHTEFKEWPIHNDDLAAAIVAFANTDGGLLILGVSKEYQIKGVGDIDKTLQSVDSVAYQNCEPPITILQEIVQDENGASVVVVGIPKGDQRPYRTNRGDYFIRTTSGRRRASRQELLRLFQSSESLYYDETLVARCSTADLGTQIIESYFKNFSQPLPNIGHEKLLHNMGFIRQQGNQYYPTLACVLFFGNKPQSFLPHAYITAARILGNDFSQPPSDTKRIEGTLLQMLEDAARFLRVHLLAPHRIQGFEPERYPELPEEALREFLINALVHRDYTVSAPIRLFVFDDRVEIRTPGGLPNMVTIDAIRLGTAHNLRNPLIYVLFNRMGLVTDIGTGVYRAISRIREITGKEPDLAVEYTEFVVSIPRRGKEENF